MRVLVITDENTGVVGVARCEGNQAKWAVELLIDNFLLENDSLVYCEVNGKYQWEEVNVIFGENWEDFMKSLTIGEFNKIWEDCFYIAVYDIHGVDNATIW